MAARRVMSLRVLLMLAVLLGAGMIVYGLLFNPVAADYNYNVGASSLTTFEVAFSGNAAGGLSPYLYTWTFGDGSGSEGQMVRHDYATPGSYDVTLTVRDSLDQTIMITKTIEVPPTPPPAASAAQPAAPNVVSPSSSMLIAGLLLIAFSVMLYAWAVRGRGLVPLWMIAVIGMIVLVAVLYLVFG